MCWALRFGFGIGVVPINAFQVCLKLLPNFHGENSATFCLIFVVEILQCFASDASQHAKHYSHQDFDMRIRQWGCPIFMTKIRQSFASSALWHTDKVSHLCIRHVSTCQHCNELNPFKVLNMLIRVVYTAKPMSLGEMDRDNHTSMFMNTVQNEYAPTIIVLSTYPYYKVKSSHDQKGSLTQP